MKPGVFVGRLETGLGTLIFADQSSFCSCPNQRRSVEMSVPNPSPESTIFKEEGYKLMGAAFEVYNQLGQGFVEEVYQESLERELALRRIDFASKPDLVLHYKGEVLRKMYQPDFIVLNEIIVELKAVKQLVPEPEAHLMNYLKSTGKAIGYLINFGCPDKLEWKRYVWTGK